MFDIIYCFDGKFWMQAAASINSLLKSKSPDTVYSIHCAVPRGTAGRRKIESLVRRTNCRLIWKELKNKENPFRNFDHRLWSPVIFYRLFAHRIFPNLQTVLYLDCDTMINHDLTELFNTEFQGFAVAAVEDLADEKNPINLFGKYLKEFKLKHIKSGLYVNSGVLLINAPLLREAEQQMLESKITLKYPDQDLLNHVLDGKIKRLPLKYNFIPGIDIIPPDKFSESEAEEARKHAVIWHFYAIKPYFHNSAVVNVYSAFFDNIKELGWHPEDFIKHEMKFTKSDEKAKIPFVGIKNGKVRFFGFRII